jgi:hypothetical protein
LLSLVAPLREAGLEGAFDDEQIAARKIEEERAKRRKAVLLIDRWAI